MITYTGRRIDLSDFKPEDVCLQDIARSLSLTCRWCGHLGVHYSVAQHCDLLAQYESSYSGHYSQLAKVCLLHDASEAYLSDISFGVKHLLPDYQRLEEQVQNTIYEKYLGFVPGEHLTSQLKELDHRLAVAEYIDIKGGDQNDLAEPHRSLDRLNVIVVPWSAEDSERKFLWTARTFGFVSAGVARPVRA